MNVDDVQARLREIEREKQDDEAAHSDQDQLFADVLTAIAEHDPASWAGTMAAEALKVLDIEFARWCA